MFFKVLSNVLVLIVTLVMIMISLLPVVGQTNNELIRGFKLTVFGSEISPLGLQARYIRKFSGEVRFKVHNLSAKNRSGAINTFINNLEKNIAGIKVRIVGKNEKANFNVYVVDRANYVKTVREKVEKRQNAKVHGKCLVKSRFSRFGISHSDAVIVSDEGNALFQRCMIEEILQGLGPLNESTSLNKSVFNDTSTHTTFTLFDRYILNMLYDKRIKNGTNERSVSKVLDAVLADTQRRLNQQAGD